MPAAWLRDEPIPVTEVSERDLVAHVTRLTHRQYSVDLGAYPLGSCTMKYNPKLCDDAASLPGLTAVHPAAPAHCTQGWLELLWSLADTLCRITGMAAATLQPPAGAAGELTGLLLMRAYHESRGETRRKVIIPDSAHGTNPASVTLGGYQTVTVPSDRRGLVDLDALRARLDRDVAGIMLTNPNTLGLFEEDIAEIAAAVHEVGGLLYYDGANLNAILGVTRPGRHGLRHRAHEPPQDLCSSPRRGRPGCRPGGGLRPAGRLPPGPAARAPPATAPSPGRRPPGQHRPGAHLARQRPGPGPGLVLHPGQRRRRPAPGGRGRRAQRQLAAPPAARRLRPALRPAQHARVRGVDDQPQEGQRACGPSTSASACSRRASTLRRCTSR